MRKGVLLLTLIYLRFFFPPFLAALRLGAALRFGAALRLGAALRFGAFLLRVAAAFFAATLRLRFAAAAFLEATAFAAFRFLVRAAFFAAALRLAFDVAINFTLNHCVLCITSRKFLL